MTSATSTFTASANAQPITFKAYIKPLIQGYQCTLSPDEQKETSLIKGYALGMLDQRFAYLGHRRIETRADREALVEVLRDDVSQHIGNIVSALEVVANETDGFLVPYISDLTQETFAAYINTAADVIAENIDDFYPATAAAHIANYRMHVNSLNNTLKRHDTYRPVNEG